MTMLITGLGTAIPTGTVSQDLAYQAMQQLCCDTDEHRRVMGMIYQGAGVNERGTVLLQEPNGLPEN